MRSRLIWTWAGFVAALLTLMATACDAVDGERIVRGQIPLERRTEEVEEACGRLALPTGSARLKTDIISKRYLGSVTNKYSTDHSCTEISTFFSSSLLSAGWLHVENRRDGLFDTGTYSVFASEAYSVEVSCNEIRDYQGIKRFSVTCFWESD